MISKPVDYGIDAPNVIRNSVLVGLALILVSAVARFLLSEFGIVAWLSAAFFISGILFLLLSAFAVWTSKVGKLCARDRLIGSLALNGHETVLDVGCGRGLLLIGVAKRLTLGKAHGIDLWRSEDESGNHSDATLTNAQIEGVADHLEVRTGDVREIPFPESMFDVVVSSLAIHNISEKDERIKAIREIARVLKPQGRIALLDVRNTQEYAKNLRDIGWQEVELSGPWFLMFPPVRVVRGKKPISNGAD